MYKKGDVVVVRKDLRHSKRYAMADGSNPIDVNDEMIALGGTEVTILLEPGEGMRTWYSIEEDGGSWSWSDEMFDGVAELPDFNVEDLSELYDFIHS